MTEKAVRSLEVTIIVICAVATIVIFFCGCATKPMRNGVGQARYELTKPDVAKADAVLEVWQKNYGKESVEICDDTFEPVINDMENDIVIPRISPETGLLGAVVDFGIDMLPLLGGGGGILLALSQALKKGKLKKFLTTQIQATEKFPDKSIKTGIAVAMSKAGLEQEFHQLVKSITEVKKEAPIAKA